MTSRVDPDWRITAEWDWVEMAGGERLHAVGTVDSSDEVLGVGRTACGRWVDMWIPGLGMRLAGRRCKQCCKATGMPRGTGSPKNSETCRPIVEARLKALEASTDV